MAVSSSILAKAIVAVVALLLAATLYNLLVPTRPPPLYMKNFDRPLNGSYFAMCTIAKNEENLAEWIEYHKRLGCGKFYLFDDNSSVPLISSIQHYVASGLVDYHFGDYSYYYRPQMRVYDLCMSNYRHRHKFIGFLDADEFIVVVNKTLKIPEVLKQFESYGGVAVQWRQFGSSGHLKKPEGGVLRNFNKCGPNAHIKTIANTLYGKQSGPSVHEYTYLDKQRYTVLTNHSRILGPFNFGTPQYDVMYLNHYNVKSWEEFQRKVVKGKAMRNKPIADPKGFFDAIDRDSREDCGYLEMPSEIS